MFASLEGSEDLFKQDTEIGVVCVIAGVVGVVLTSLGSSACQQAGGLIFNVIYVFQKVIFYFPLNLLVATSKAISDLSSTVGAVMELGAAS